MTEYVKIEKEVWESTLRASMDRAGELEKTKKQLEIAKDFIFRCANDISGDWYINNAKGTLKKIEELEK